MTEEQEEPQVDWARMESETTGGQPQTQFLSAEMLARRLLWDVVPCNMAVEAGAYIGLPPASEEIEDMEHQQSHQRMMQAAPVIPFVAELAKHSTRAVVGSNIIGMAEDEPDLSDEEKNEIITKLYPMIYQTSLATLAELIDMGVLHLPHYRMVAVAEEEAEESDDG